MAYTTLAPGTSVYTFWPEFICLNATPMLNRRRRFVTGPHLYNGAKYLVLTPETVWRERCDFQPYGIYSSR